MSSGTAQVEQLPGHLAERVLVRNGEGGIDGDFVLCWLHHALRIDRNPALEAAAAAATALDVPLFVYQGLGGRHRYNADRHHRFILEAARDLDAALREHGHRLWFHLPREPDAPGPLRGLTARAALVVTELYPVPPFSRWYRAGQAWSGTPWWFVDASCVVPMTLSRKRFDRAFAFRRAWEDEYAARVGAPWPEPDLDALAFDGDPGFEPFDLDSDLAAAIAACRIDHAVGPVGDTPGGLHAAERRWEQFRAAGLSGYAKRRNDAAERWPRGVSRLSPYLHYGCIAPARVAADAAGTSGRGPEKFLDELLIWRELAHHFCFRTRDPEALAALPEWAVATLAEHGEDPRDVLDWKTLARGRSGDRLWDLAQRSLLRRGELHNNVRMTWGKALPRWSAGPAEALARLVDLNHRYALDGNDPNSYGGLLWCLGQFDRPFPPERDILGTVRPRSTTSHARRLDLDAWAAQVSRPSGGRELRCVIIGAGIAGLTCARILQDHGHAVQVVEKGRGPGGRASTRRHGDLRFDHGAQYFTARDERFRRHVRAWVEAGHVAPWNGRIGAVDDSGSPVRSGETERFVGVPGMSAVAVHLAADLDPVVDWRAVRVERDGPELRVTGPAGATLGADVVVVTAPPVQARDLLADLELELPPLPELAPCWAVMLHLPERPLEGFDALFVNAGPLSWVARQAGRPGRPEAEAWVLHATEAWTREHLEDEPDRVGNALLSAFRALPGVRSIEPIDVVAHRWRHARADVPLDVGALWLPAPGIALAGDWLAGSRIEGAFLSGAAAAGRILGSELALGR